MIVPLKCVVFISLMLQLAKDFYGDFEAYNKKVWIGMLAIKKLMEVKRVTWLGKHLILSTAIMACH